MIRRTAIERGGHDSDATERGLHRRRCVVVSGSGPALGPIVLLVVARRGTFGALRRDIGRWARPVEPDLARRRREW